MRLLIFVNSAEHPDHDGITEEGKRAMDALSKNLREVVVAHEGAVFSACILTSNERGARENAGIIRGYFPNCYFEEHEALWVDDSHQPLYFRALELILENFFYSVVIVVTHHEYVKTLPAAYAYEAHRQLASFSVPKGGEAIVVAFRTSCSSEVVPYSRGKDCCGKAEAIDDDGIEGIPF